MSEYRSLLYRSLADYLSTVKHPQAREKIKKLENLHAGIRPFFDYINNDGYFVSDGYGCKYSSMHFRKISIEGEEIAAFRTYNSVRCFYYYPQGTDILIALDNKFVILDSLTLKPNKIITKGIPKYINECIVYRNNIYATKMDNIIFCYDLELEKLQKITLPNTKSIKQIFPQGFLTINSRVRSKFPKPKIQLLESKLLIETMNPAMKFIYDLEKKEFIEITKLDIVNRIKNFFFKQ